MHQRDEVRLLHLLQFCYEQNDNLLRLQGYSFFFCWLVSHLLLLSWLCIKNNKNYKSPGRKRDFSLFVILNGRSFFPASCFVLFCLALKWLNPGFLARILPFFVIFRRFRSDLCVFIGLALFRAYFLSMRCSITYCTDFFKLLWLYLCRGFYFYRLALFDSYAVCPRSSFVRVCYFEVLGDKVQDSIHTLLHELFTHVFSTVTQL